MMYPNQLPIAHYYPADAVLENTLLWVGFKLDKTTSIVLDCKYVTQESTPLDWLDSVADQVIGLLFDEAQSLFTYREPTLQLQVKQLLQ